MASLLSRDDSSTADKVLGLFSAPWQSQIQINAFFASVGVSLGFTAALTLLFSFLRPHHRLIYAPRTKYSDANHALPPMGKGPFSWIKPVAKAKEEMLLEKLGLDAVIFLRFARMLRNIFCVLAVIGLVVMIPCNVGTGVKAIQDKSNVFAVMTPLYTFGNGLWAQVVVAYAIDLVIIYFIWYNYRKVLALKRTWFSSEEYQQSLHSRSLLIRHIPKNLRSEAGILQLVDEVKSASQVPIPIAVRNVKDVPELLEQHEDAVRKLESILAKYLKNPDRLPAKPTIRPPKSYRGPLVGGKVDAIDYYREHIKTLEQNINGMRQQIDQRDVLPFGFAAFDHTAQAHVVAHAARKKSPHGTKIRLAPRSNDIIWKNMPLSKSQLRKKAIMNAIWVALLTVAWTPLNAGLAIFISNLSNLGSLWPTFQVELQRHKAFWSVVQGIAAPAITSLIYLLLPTIFRRLQVRAGDVTRSTREMHVLRNLFNFFILNNLIIFSLFSAIWQYITAVIEDSKTDKSVWDALKHADFFLVVTTQLCQSISPFWVTWILQRNLGAAIDLAQLWTLFYQWFAKTFLAPTPRQYIEWTAPQPFQYASYYNYFLFYAAVSLCFATLQPIILLCTAIYFVVDSVLKKYLLMYVFVTKTESGGIMWRILINRLIFSCILADVIIGVVVKARGTWSMVIALAPLVLAMIGFKWYCATTFDPDMEYFQRDEKHANEAANFEPSVKAVNRAAARFRHPALEKKLITPMVSAKAQHVVQQIYSGRLNSDADQGPGTFSDIPLQVVTPGNKRDSRMPFEAVPEGQQDFQFYQNRADFRDIGGDKTGIPADLIQSRPGTPASRLSTPPRPLSPYLDSRPGSPAAIARKEVGSGYASHGNRNPRYSHLAQVETNEGGDISLMPKHGPYTDPNDDRATLLKAAEEGHTANGQFLSMDQWQTPGATPLNRAEGGSYDYFRGHGGLS